MDTEKYRAGKSWNCGRTSGRHLQNNTSINICHVIMEILNKIEHLGCLYYEKGERPTVEILNLEQNHEEEMSLRKNEIVFMTEGKLSFTFRNHPEKIIHKGQFIFITVGGVFHYVVLEKTRMVVLRLNEHISLCKGYYIEQLYGENGELAIKSRREVCALEINRPLWRFLNELNETVASGLNCRYYFDMKVRELLLLLRAYYPPEQLREFFSLIMTPETVFYEYIQANYPRYPTIGELAASMNLSVKHFGKVFTRIFGVPPGKWLNSQRAHIIYSELHSGNKPIKQIADEYGFPTQQHLNRFCKRELGKNPGEIRRKKGTLIR